jgi:hypothetical protein
VAQAQGAACRSNERRYTAGAVAGGPNRRRPVAAARIADHEGQRGAERSTVQRLGDRYEVIRAEKHEGGAPGEAEMDRPHGVVDRMVLFPSEDAPEEVAQGGVVNGLAYNLAESRRMADI